MSRGRRPVLRRVQARRPTVSGSRLARSGTAMTERHHDDPRQRRRRRRREDARQEILDAAWELADREGIGGVSLSDVARTVGMRAPSLYNYFSSKLDIIDAMFEQAATQFRAAMAAA